MKNELARKGILDGARAFTGPYGLQIGLISACNYQCEFCGRFSHRKPAEPDGAQKPIILETETFVSLVESAKALDVEQISIVGVGEPFLHKGIMDLIRSVKRNSIRCMVTTNGSLLNRKTVETLVDCELDILNVSINAGTAQTYEKIHGQGRGDFLNRILGMLALLKRLKAGREKPALNLRYVINKTNRHEIEKFVTLAIRAGADEVTFQTCVAPPFDPGQALDKNGKGEVALILGRVNEKLANAGIATNAGFIASLYSQGGKGHEREVVEAGDGYYRERPCYVGWTYAMILENGNVFPCCYCAEPMGNISAEPFDKIWFGEKYSSFRKRAKNLPTHNENIDGCACFSWCGSIKDNIRTAKRLGLT